MRRAKSSFIPILFFLLYFLSFSYIATKEPSVKLGKKEIQLNNLLIEHTFKDSVTQNKFKIEKLDDDSSSIPEEMLQAAYISYVLLSIESKTTKYEILEIHYLSPETALVSVRISIPDLDTLIRNKYFNDFIDKKLNEKLKNYYSADIEKLSDQEINELYSLTFIVISEAILEYSPEIKDFKAQNITMKVTKTNNIWTLEDSIYNYTEF